MAEKEPYRDKELLEYEQKIKSALMNNPKIKKLMCANNDKGYKMTDEEFLNDRILPFEYVIETVEDTWCYLCYDISIYGDDKTYKNVEIRFYISCSVRHYYDENGVGIPEQISLEISDMLLSDEFQNDLDQQFGLHLKFVSNRPYHKQYHMIGREVDFTTKEWANGKKNGR